MLKRADKTTTKGRNLITANVPDDTGAFPLTDITEEYDRQEQRAKGLSSPWRLFNNLGGLVDTGVGTSFAAVGADPVGAAGAAATNTGVNYVANKLSPNPSLLSEVRDTAASALGFTAASKLARKLIPYYGKVAKKTFPFFTHPAVLAASSLLDPDVRNGTYRMPILANKENTEDPKSKAYPDPDRVGPLNLLNVGIGQAVDTLATSIGGLPALLFSKGGGIVPIWQTAKNLSYINSGPEGYDAGDLAHTTVNRFGLWNAGVNFRQAYGNETKSKNAVTRLNKHNPEEHDIQSLLPENGFKDPASIMVSSLSELPGAGDRLRQAANTPNFLKVFRDEINNHYHVDDPNEAIILHRVMYQSGRARDRKFTVPLTEEERKAMAVKVNKVTMAQEWCKAHGIPPLEDSNEIVAYRHALSTGSRPATKHEVAIAIRNQVHKLAVKLDLPFPIAALAYEQGFDPSDKSANDKEFSSMPELRRWSYAYRKSKQHKLPFNWRQRQYWEVKQSELEDAQNQRRRRGNGDYYNPSPRDSADLVNMSTPMNPTIL